MQIKYLLTIISFVLVYCMSWKIYPRLSYDTKELPVYKINIDLPVKERYKEILTIYKDKIQVYAAKVDQSNIARFISKFKLGKYLINHRTQDPEFYEFIEAVAEYSGVSLGQAALISANYEIACTSLIVQDNKDKIILARNLDFSTYFVLAHLIYEAHYYKNGELQAKVVEMAGFRGIINGIKPGKFALSFNMRRYGNSLSHLFRIYAGKSTSAFLFLKVIENANSYQEAFDILKSDEITAPTYYVLSGVNKNEGVIITRNIDGVYNIDQLDVDMGKWFLVITNTDLDKKESPDDFRRIPAQNNLKKIGRDNINCENLFKDVMSIYPTNNLITIHTSIQDTGNGYLNNTLWLP